MLRISVTREKMFVFGVQKCLGTWSCLPISRQRLTCSFLIYTTYLIYTVIRFCIVYHLLVIHWGFCVFLNKIYKANFIIVFERVCDCLFSG